MTTEVTGNELIALVLHTRKLYTEHLNTLNENITLPLNNVSPEAVLKMFDQNHFAAMKVTQAEIQHFVNSPEELAEIEAQYKDSIESAKATAQDAVKPNSSDAA